MNASSENSVSEWITSLKVGDPEAVEQLCERYFRKLVELARRRLGDASKRVADEEDVALSVFDSLCRGAKRGRFSDLSNREDLWKLLLKMTRNKVIDQIRHYTSQKRGGGEIRGESVFERVFEDEAPMGIDQVVGEEPDPAFVVLMDEQYQQLLGSLRNDTLRKIAQWKLEGFTNDEISEMLGLVVRSIERKVNLIRRTWSKFIAVP